MASIYFTPVLSVEVLTVSATGNFSASVYPFHPIGLTEEVLVVKNAENNTFEIFNRDADGNFEAVNTVAFDEDFPFTDGKWIGAVSTGSLSVGKLINNEVTNLTSLDVTGRQIYCAGIFPDNTIVIADSKNQQLVTYKFYESSNSWDLFNSTAYSGLGLQAFTRYSPNAEGNALWPKLAISPNPTTCFQGNNLFGVTAAYPFKIAVLARQPDLSWNIVETIPFPGDASSPLYYYYGFAAYNGLDTVAISAPEFPRGGSPPHYGLVSIISKAQNGTWSTTQVLTSSGLGYQPPSVFGIGLQFIDPTTLVIGTGSGINYASGGHIAIMSRNVVSGKWEQSYDISTTDPVAFARGFGLNKRDLVAFGHSTVDGLARVYGLPRCLFEAINATCLTMELNDCKDIPLDDLYSFDPTCGALEVSWSGLSIEGNHATPRYTFTKPARTASCNATVICPVVLPPISEVPPMTPVTLPATDAPMTTPIEVSVPVTRTTPHAKVSDGSTRSIIGLSLVLLLTAFI